MLDLGVGTGRTTNYFAPLFEKYIGVDFSEAMINSCRRRYVRQPNSRFEICDVLDMPDFGMNFDFIFFSFQGIDCLSSDQERIQLIGKVKTLLKPGGIFAFSSHSTAGLEKLYSFQMPRRNPFRIITEFLRYRKIRRMNGSIDQYLDKDFVRLYDGGENFLIQVGYIKPSSQLLQLQDAGFKRISVMDRSGNYITVSKIDQCRETVLYYICQ